MFEFRPYSPIFNLLKMYVQCKCQEQVANHQFQLIDTIQMSGSNNCLTGNQAAETRLLSGFKGMFGDCSIFLLHLSVGMPQMLMSIDPDFAFAHLST